MVEATQNAHKLQPAVGCIVTESCTDHSQWVGATLLEAFSVGKEVFLIFYNDCGIRLHFGMNGSLYPTNKSTLYIPDYKCQQGALLQLMFKTLDGGSQPYLLECFLTTVCDVTARVARSKRERLAHLDCCACEEIFDFHSVAHAL